MSAEVSATRTERSASSKRMLTERLRITRRGIQIALGFVWLLDGVLQFQSFMYTHAFITEVIEPSAQGQPGFIGTPILTFAHFYGHDLTLWNTLAAEIQCAIGLGLIVSRRTVRPALLASFFWAFIVWWFGEGLGMLFSGAPASPLTGAPGAAFVYLMVALLVWPKDENADGMPVDGGLLGRSGALIVWSVIWLDAAVLWLLHVDRSKNAITEQLSGVAEGAPHWLATAQSSLAKDLGGDGVTAATFLAILSVVIAAGVWTRLRPAALVIGAALSLLYWIYGQSLGGPFWIGGETDVNTGPLLVLLAATVWIAPKPAISKARARDPGAARELSVGAG